MSVNEWRSELKVITWILIAATVIEGGRRLLGFTTEKINSIDVLLWVGIYALIRLARLILDWRRTNFERAEAHQAESAGS